MKRKVKKLPRGEATERVAGLDQHLAAGGSISDWIVPSVGKRLADMTFAEVAQAQKYFSDKNKEAKTKEFILRAYKDIARERDS